MTDKHDKLVEMARDCGLAIISERGQKFRFTVPQLAAFRSAILADAAKDVEPSLYRGTKLLPYETRYFGTKGMAERLGYTEDLKAFCDASTLAAAQALNAELRLVLAQRVPPGCVVVPVEPTEAMIDAADDAETRHVVAERRRGGTDTQLAWGVAYKAMIAAAPQAKEQTA